MKKLFYEEGPLVMGCGAAGEFRIGVPKEVEDDQAAVLLRKGRLKEFVEDPAPAAASKRKGTDSISAPSKEE